jgi:hypothetical protein
MPLTDFSSPFEALLTLIFGLPGDFIAVFGRFWGSVFFGARFFVCGMMCRFGLMERLKNILGKVWDEVTKPELHIKGDDFEKYNF